MQETSMPQRFLRLDRGLRAARSDGDNGSCVSVDERGAKVPHRFSTGEKKL
jgi:hypothetical protein